jgi:hypothetical protein
MFIGNFRGTYERPSTVGTLKTIKQKHDESLRDFVKCFYNARKLSCTSKTLRSSMLSVTGSVTSRLWRRSP